MPVRMRIALWFTATVFLILVIMGGVLYYHSYNTRLRSVKTRLLTRANNIASFFKQSDVFNSQLIQRIDTSTAASARDKEVQVYDRDNRKVYAYSDRKKEALLIDHAFLQRVRDESYIFFTRGRKEAIAIFDPQSDIVIISATVDEQGKNFLFQLRITLWLSLIGGAIITLIGGYLFAGRLLRPIKAIADEVNEISAKSLAHRIPTGAAKDEWHYLSSTLNQLLNRLQHAIDMHRRFISHASHELSAPLASMCSQLEISLQRSRVEGEYRNVMLLVHRDALHLSKLTQTLLEFAKTSGSESGLEIQPVRVDEVLLRLTAELSRGGEYEVLLEFENLPEEEELLLVFGNEELLFTSVKNIVVNACKYSPDKRAFVRLSVNSDISIEVIDNGLGISSAELEHIFQPFFRGEQAGSVPGFGLGLSLSQKIIKLHKGKILIESSPGLGTRLEIILPPAYREKELNLGTRD